jgi:hypothetical protein
MTDEGNEKVQVTCYQCGAYHYHEASTSTTLLQIEDFTWKYHSKHLIINPKNNSLWQIEIWLYKTKLKEAHECVQSLHKPIPCLLKPQPCVWSNQWPTSKSSLLERTHRVHNPLKAISWSLITQQSFNIQHSLTWPSTITWKLDSLISC